MSVISSDQNPKIKETAALTRKKERDITGLILVEGRHPIEEALAAGLAIERLFHLEHLVPAFETDIEPLAVSEKAMAKMATTESPPPYLAVFRQPKPQALSTQATRLSLALVLDSLQDPGNLGTLIRSALAFGVDGLILTGEAVDPYNPKVIRGSAGLVFRIPLFQERPATLIEAFRTFKAYAAMPPSYPQCISYRDADFKSPCVLLLGNEGRGLSETLLQWPGLQGVTIPISDKVESLNVATSGSILLAEAAAQRGLSGQER